MRDGDENILGFLRSPFPTPVQEKLDSTVGAWGVSAEVWFSPGKWGASCVGTLKASFLPLTDVSSLVGGPYGTRTHELFPSPVPSPSCPRELAASGGGARGGIDLTFGSLLSLTPRTVCSQIAAPAAVEPGQQGEVAVQ